MTGELMEKHSITA